MFYLSLATGTATIIAGGVIVAGSLAPIPNDFALGEHARTAGTVLLQIGIVLELVAVALHERLTLKDLHRGLGRMTTAMTTLQATVLPGGRL